MIDKKIVLEIVEKEIADSNLFIVDVSVSASNAISVMIDSMEGVPISTCIELSRAIEKNFDRDAEDFELQVASAGIGQPFQVIQQYQKNIGKDVEVLTTDGMKHKGKLITVGENEIEIEVEEKVKVEGKKKKQVVVNAYSFAFDQIKSTKDIITF
ncbi:ribosome assembly cofactor RimP [Marinifilum caeruleilacunae]|uniref:Ribosome maturation factor RimP n=1 Tax=Marinifilum caeruleilacunae TaxID=2499076 RepID=A0ABX1WZX8_9BACT|nr:ribosome assembly cofactor RimP [Marinifilum caeruleilacunae]NOU61614.1 ribosome assembly cofactor RimP [Marinifilum caeruleilacunae]